MTISIKLLVILIFVTVVHGHILNTRARRQAVAESVLWPNKRVPYRINPQLSEGDKNDALTAMKFFEQNTCVDFREATTADSVSANISGRNPATGGCSSPQGVYSAMHVVVSLGCGVTTNVHEISHLLGVAHTQVRSDRDDFIFVNDAVLKPKNITDYNKVPGFPLYGIPYDYGSILHYSVGPKTEPRFLPLISAYSHTAGAVIFPSFYDVELVNVMYRCHEQCHESTVKCENGGYNHPRDCNKCICPLGFRGTTCDEILTDGECGGVLFATSEWQDSTVNMNSKNMGRDIFNYAYCSWHIEAPAGKKVEIWITKIASGDKCDDPYWPSCRAGFEFKIAVDTRLTGARYCCPDESTKIISHLNTVPIIGFDQYNANLTASFSFRYVDASTPSTLSSNYGIPIPPSNNSKTRTSTTTTTTTTQSTTTVLTTTVDLYAPVVPKIVNDNPIICETTGGCFGFETTTDQCHCFSIEFERTNKRICFDHIARCLGTLTTENRCSCLWRY